MKRLYKFFFILFFILFAISIVYGTIISWVAFKILLLNSPHNVKIGPVPFLAFFKLGFFQALIYAPILLLMIIFLFDRSIRRKQKFAIRNILSILFLFLLITTIIYILYFWWLMGQGDFFAGIYILAGPQFTLPPAFWFPFPIAWLTLYIILAARIKKTE